jgi:hypothetical protein
MDLGLAVETVDYSILRRTDALKLLANILAGKNEGPGTGAQLRLDQYVLQKNITNWFALHDTNKVATLNVRWQPWDCWLVLSLCWCGGFTDNEGNCAVESACNANPGILWRESGNVFRVSGWVLWCCFAGSVLPDECAV